MTPSIETLLRLLDRLEKANTSYTLQRNRQDTITIAVAVPGQRWEIDVFADGDVDVEVFQSDGTIHDESKLQSLFQVFSD